MKRFFLMALILFFGTTLVGVEEPTGFRGYEAVNKTLQDRLFTDDPAQYPVTLGRYIGGDSLGTLMGYYEGTGLTSGFYNGNPNATNMLLWYLAFDGLSGDLSKICLPGEQPDVIKRVNLNYKKILLNLCAWPEESSRNATTLQELWTATMGYDAPDSEFDIWKEYFLSDKFAHSDATGVIKDLLQTIFLDPYFLLRP